MYYNRLADVLNGREANYMLPFYWQHGDHTATIPEEVERIYRSGARAFCSRYLSTSASVLSEKSTSSMPAGSSSE